MGVVYFIVVPIVLAAASAALILAHLAQLGRGLHRARLHAYSHLYASTADMLHAMQTDREFHRHRFRTVLGVSGVYTICRGDAGLLEHTFSSKSLIPIPMLQNISFLLLFGTIGNHVKEAGIETGGGFFKIEIHDSGSRYLTFRVDDEGQRKLAAGLEVKR